MAELDLYIDTTARKAVASFTDSSPFTIPAFTQDDTINLRVRLMTRTETFNSSTPYEFVPNTGLTLEVAIGTRVGTGGTLYTQQFTWTLSSDSSDPYFYASLPINTDEIATLLGSSDSKSAYFEIKFIQDGVPTTVLSQQVTVQAAVIHSDSVAVPAGLTPLYAETAAAVYLQRVITCSAENPVTFQNPNGKAVSVFVDTDGTWHADPIA